MFTTATGIKRSIYGQTGNFQFNTNLIIDSAFGGLNVGISGENSIKINTYCNSGKIWDDSGRFVGVYSPNKQFSISGNVADSGYDLFINGKPVSYGNVKPTGTYNYFYINPEYITCQYNWFLNGERPNLTISDITCNTGDIAGTGYITNNSIIPVRIFSGDFANLSSNSAITLSGLFTGDLISSEKFYIVPDGRRSFGDYNTILRLYTNGGIINYSNSISVTGNEAPVFPEISLNGSSIISNGQNNSYTSDIKYIFDTGIPISVTLEYISGSGDFYTDIAVQSNYSGNITGYILETGILSQYIESVGTGAGGQLNNTGSGPVTGYISGGITYARGTFTWPYTTFVYGYATGIGYSGLGTGLHYGQMTGTIVGDSGVYKYEDYYYLRPETRTVNTLINSGPTGYIQPTGAIYWNLLAGNHDKVWIRNVSQDRGGLIVFNYDFLVPEDLAWFINTYFGEYLEAGVAPMHNFFYYAVEITGKKGSLSQFVLERDGGNKNNVLHVSGPMCGAQDLGVGVKTLISNKVTGIMQEYFNPATSVIPPYYQSITNLISYFTGSGYYVNTGQGTLYGSGSVVDYTKTFTGCWNLLTGETFNQLDYRAAGYYNAEQNKYSNDYPVNYINSAAFLNVQYSNSLDSFRDVAKLTVTGIGYNTGLKLLITGGY